MVLNLPIYKIVGERPIKMVRTSDGGAELLAWDWAAKDLGAGTVEDFDALN